MNKLSKHLREVEETYFQHLNHALYFAFQLLAAALACTIHGFFPFLFERTGSTRIEKLHAMMVVNRTKLSTTKKRDNSTNYTNQSQARRVP